MITMLSNLETGWSKLKIGDFTDIPSYITDVPVDLLTVFIDYYKKIRVQCYSMKRDQNLLLY